MTETARELRFIDSEFEFGDSIVRLLGMHDKKERGVPFLLFK